jgi:hypothetical protein
MPPWHPQCRPVSVGQVQRRMRRRHECPQQTRFPRRSPEAIGATMSSSAGTLLRRVFQRGLHCDPMTGRLPESLSGAFYQIQSVRDGDVTCPGCSPRQCPNKPDKQGSPFRHTEDRPCLYTALACLQRSHQPARSPFHHTCHRRHAPCRDSSDTDPSVVAHERERRTQPPAATVS